MGKFEKARQKFRNMIEELKRYDIVHPVVYNTDIDDINHDEIKLIIVADNPGKEEQKAQRYLIGSDDPRSAGYIAQKFFSDHPELGIEFRKNGRIKDVLVLNKTPIHSSETKSLDKLWTGGGEIKKALKDSQETMATLLVEFQEVLHVPVWIVGCDDDRMMKGVFNPFVDKLKDLYAERPKLLEDVLIFYHFSHHCFTSDLKTLADKSLELEQALPEIGGTKRKKYLG